MTLSETRGEEGKERAEDATNEALGSEASDQILGDNNIGDGPSRLNDFCEARRKNHLHCIRLRGE